VLCSGMYLQLTFTQLPNNVTFCQRDLHPPTAALNGGVISSIITESRARLRSSVARGA
jgi:hypothetical protein